MNDYDTEQAKSLRRARLVAIKPKAAPMMLNESDFRHEYVEFRFIALAHKAELEETNNIMFCPACYVPVNNVMAKARVLHICYEEDALGNFPLIATAKCQGCEWEEMIPVVKPELSDSDRDLLRRYHNAIATSKLSSPGSLYPNVWSNKIKDELMLTPSAIQQITGTGPIAIGMDSRTRFGQSKASAVWDSIAKNQQEQRELELAKQQIKMIEQVEAEQAKRQQAKASQIATNYGMQAAQAHNMMGNYADEIARAMRNQLDEELYRQISAGGAGAAKVAHNVLLDKVKQVFKK